MFYILCEHSRSARADALDAAALFKQQGTVQPGHGATRARCNPGAAPDQGTPAGPWGPRAPETRAYEPAANATTSGRQSALPANQRRDVASRERPTADFTVLRVVHRLRDGLIEVVVLHVSRPVPQHP